VHVVEDQEERATGGEALQQLPDGVMCPKPLGNADRVLNRSVQLVERRKD
jgi:hypothetical protein